MYFSGFADEAGASIDVQIKATKEAGWKYIELRNIDGVNITDITDEAFDTVCQKLADAGIQVNAFGSNVANWGKSPFSEKDFERSCEELKRAVPRMKALGVPYLRAMSFKAAGTPITLENSASILEKVKKLVEICEDNGIVYCHENCMNYFSQSYELIARLSDAIPSKSFAFLYDSGNQVYKDNKMGTEPFEKQTAWGMYQAMKDRIVHVHIKDGVPVRDEKTGAYTDKFTFAGEGNADVPRILRDLKASGYDGGYSIEPHMVVVYHEAANQEDKSREQFDNYVMYAKKFESLYHSIS